MTTDPQGLRVLAEAAFIAASVALSLIDLRTLRLPDVLTLPLLWTGLLLNSQFLFTSCADAVQGAALGYCLLWIPDALYRSGDRTGGCFGGGDLKLAAAIGSWFGKEALLVALMLAFMVGASAVLPLAIRGKNERKQRVPFGPALMLGAIVVMLTGADPVLRTFSRVA